MALLWAAGIIWFAYDVADSAPDADANSTNADDCRRADQRRRQKSSPPRCNGF